MPVTMRRGLRRLDWSYGRYARCPRRSETYLSVLTSKHEGPPTTLRPAEDVLVAASRQRLERDWSAPMSERLAKLHELCKQLTAIAGAARRP